MELGNEFEVLKKWGKTITFRDTKYDLEEFTTMLGDNEEFFNEIKDNIVLKIKEADLNIEANVEDQI